MGKTNQVWTEWGVSQVQEIQKFINSWDSTAYNLFELGMIKFDFSTTRAVSRGGLYRPKGIKVPGISIAMYPYVRADGKSPVYIFREYASFEHDLKIGNIYSSTMEQVVLAVICHEMAHAIQYWHCFYTNSDRYKPHGVEFKKYYRMIREKFINPYLEDQVELKKLFNLSIEEAIRQGYRS